MQERRAVRKDGAPFLRFIFLLSSVEDIVSTHKDASCGICAAPNQDGRADVDGLADSGSLG